MRNDQIDSSFQAIRLADDPEADNPAKLRQRKLKELADRLEQHHVFSKGQSVKWKVGLKNKKSPEYGEPAIVTAVLPTPIFDRSENDAGNPYFQEPLTIVIGLEMEDDFIEYRVDGRRFEPFGC